MVQHQLSDFSGEKSQAFQSWRQTQKKVLLIEAVSMNITTVNCAMLDAEDPDLEMELQEAVQLLCAAASCLTAAEAE